MEKVMPILQKKKIIQQIIDNKSYELLTQNWFWISKLSRKGDVMLRVEIAEMLKYFHNSDQINLLISMIYDRAVAVRMEVVASLCDLVYSNENLAKGVIESEKIYNALSSMSFDSNRVVRAYAVEGMSWMQYKTNYSLRQTKDDYEKFILKQLEINKGLYSQAAYYFALIIIEKYNYLDSVFEIYDKASYYLTKIYILNGLDSVFDENTHDKIEKFLKLHANDDNVLSVQEAFDRLGVDNNGVREI